MTKNQIKFAREVLDEYPSEKEVYSFADGNVFLSGAKTHALNQARSTGKQFSLIRRDEIEALEAAAEAAEKAAAEATFKAKLAAKEADEKAAKEKAGKAAKKTDKEVEQPKAPTSPVAEPEKTGSIDDIINHAD